jgi:cell fate regulator YaaT (PSP1 superfamily)
LDSRLPSLKTVRQTKCFLKLLSSAMPKYIVRYGLMRMLGVFDAGSKLSAEQIADEGQNGEIPKFERETKVIIRTDRGLEAGEVLCEAADKVVGGLAEVQNGQILRRMTDDDSNELSRINERAPQQLEICQKCIDKLGLLMRLVDVEHIFGGERIIVYYLADGRVDFRELVRVLAGEFQTRIEMRQIGVRDEAKLMADYGDCGKPVCCNSNLSQMPPVSMKMAKLQKATLDPTKISGRCGRLKCCLRYEFDVYEQLQKLLPPVGAMVETDNGRACVIAQEILAQAVLVEDCDQMRKLLRLEEIRGIIATEAVDNQSEKGQNELSSDDNQDITVDS